MKFRVYSTIDRGKTIPDRQRYMTSACHAFAVDIESAEKIAKQERSKPYVTSVWIEPTKDVI